MDTLPVQGIPAAAPNAPSVPPLRILLVSTPRSGNNWLRRLLAALYGIPSLAIHNPADLDWAALPPSCVLGIHWQPVPAFRTLLQQHGFRPLVLARHPLDVLISILHFAAHASTIRWLEGEGGNEFSIHGVTPRCAAFREYARGPRAAALLSVSRRWWSEPGCLRLRYEALVAHPYAALNQLVQGLGVPTCLAPEAALIETTIAKLRAVTGCPYHFWQGRPGLWKRLLPTAEAQPIAAAHVECFTTLGYTCDTDPYLRADVADAQWIDALGAQGGSEAEPRGGRSAGTHQSTTPDSSRRCVQTTYLTHA